MARDSFYDRLENYYRQVAAVIGGEADAASVFSNASDIGSSRETIYAEFLRQHVPSKCNVVLGGFLFHEDGSESRQIDIIVTTDTAPQFKLRSGKGEGKSFAPVEGTLAVASIKSQAGKREIHDALSNIGSIPPTQPLKMNPMITNMDDEFPLKIVFAYGSKIDATAIYGSVIEYYSLHSEIPLDRRPHVIHIAGTCAIFRAIKGYELKDVTTQTISSPKMGSFQMFTLNPDLQAILFVLSEVQRRATFSNHILYQYKSIMDGVQEAAAVRKLQANDEKT